MVLDLDFDFEDPRGHKGHQGTSHSIHAEEKRKRDHATFKHLSVGPRPKLDFDLGIDYRKKYKVILVKHKPCTDWREFNAS